jgi:hypothetical protein
MKKIIVTALFFIFSISVHAAGFSSKDDARKYADKLMDHFVKKEFQVGLNDAKKYWPIPAVEIDGMANQINQQWPIVDQRFGAAISKEFVKEKNIGESFVRYYYLHKFENHSIYWKIDFYKPRDAWQINTIVFLDNLEPLYE